VTVARVLLLVPARTYRATDFLVAASRLGLKLVVGSDGALPLSHEHVIRVDPQDVEASADRLVAQSGPVDAVVAVDTPMLVLAAAAAARMGLAHNPVEAVRAATDKAQQRRCWAAAGVAQPAFRIVPADATEDALQDAAARVGVPCVVKAVSLSGSQGVLGADDAAGTLVAAGRIRQILADAGRPADEPLLVEAYVPGWELSVDGLLTAGQLTVTAVFDKPDTPKAPPSRRPCSLPPLGCPNRFCLAPSVLPSSPPPRSGSATAPSTPSCDWTPVTAAGGRPCWSWRAARSVACAHAPCGSLTAQASNSWCSPMPWAIGCRSTAWPDLPAC
jgi:hypothetical protein